MATIDYRGQFFACGICTDCDSRAALRFPIDADSAREARRFAEREILKMLPGWRVGRLYLRKGDRRLKSTILRRREDG